MEGPVFYSQGRTQRELSFLWHGGAKVEPGAEEARTLYREVTRVRNWITLDRSGPVEILCALQTGGQKITLGIQVRTDTLDDVGRRLLVEGVWTKQKVPSPEQGAEFLEAAKEAIQKSGRAIDADVLDAACREIVARWSDIDWPPIHDVGGFLKRSWQSVIKMFESNEEPR